MSERGEMKRIILRICFAFKFLTILPLPCDGEAKGASGYFPLVGLLIGATLFAFNYLFSFFLPPLVRGSFLLMILVLITGALHIDGLADTADAVFGAKTREEALRIMKDERIGTFGATAIFLLLLAKASLLVLFAHSQASSFLLFPAVARFSVTLSCYLFTPARDEGLGNLFLTSTTARDVATAVVIVSLPGIILLKIYFLIPFLATILIGYLISRYLSQKTGGLTGDHLGALIEITELSSLLFFVIFQQFPFSFSGRIFP